MQKNDNNYFVYILFYAFGIMTQVSTNFFMTATDYWMYKFRDVTKGEDYDHDHRTGLQKSFSSTYSIVSATSNFLFLALAFLFLLRFSLVTRMVVTLSTISTLFVVNLIFIGVNTDSWQMGFFVLVVVMGFFLTGCSQIFMLTLFEMISKFPPIYLPPILSGQAVCGIFAAVTQIIALSIGVSSKATGLIYFSIGTFFVMGTGLGFLLLLKKSEFFRAHINKFELTEKPKFSKDVFIGVLKKIKIYMASQFVILGSTVIVHPAMTALVVSVDKGNGNAWNDKFFVPVITFLLYNIFDYIGREIGSKMMRPKNGYILLAISLIRVALVPLLVFCNTDPREKLSVIFDQDWAYIIFIILFAISHGYIIILTAAFVRIRVHSDEEIKIAMYFLLIFMQVSGMACSYLSILIINSL